LAIQGPANLIKGSQQHVNLPSLNALDCAEIKVGEFGKLLLSYSPLHSEASSGGANIAQKLRPLLEFGHAPVVQKAEANENGTCASI